MLCEFTNLLYPIRTLDQSYYHMLADTANRDADQVVARRAKKEHHENRGVYSESTDGSTENFEYNILMVDQLWLWFIRPASDSKDLPIVITSFPSRQGVKGKNTRIIDNLRGNVLQSLPGHTQETILSPGSLISQILTVCCRTLDRHQHIRSMQFMQLFQSTVGGAVSFQNYHNDHLCAIHREYIDVL